ncbi:hypothetical protein TNCV_3206001 [Trichonephila clavipes]|nr:hypothetical protein TNCV_3206001 [Trichonephila clavipes]
MHVQAGKSQVMGQLDQALGYNGALSRSRLSFNKIAILIISRVKYYFRLYSPKNWEFRMICQLATRDDRRPYIGLSLAPYIIQLKGGSPSSRFV